jgi:hypothetical protein
MRSTIMRYSEGCRPLSGNNRAMSDESQIHVPPSFVALFLPPGGVKPTQPRAVIAARYEVCEDLAQLLTDRASTIRWQHGAACADVLGRIRSGLLSEGSGVDAAEAHWVVRRLAELLEWDWQD